MAEMDPFIRKSLADDGFMGFVTFDALRSGVIREVPQTGGVYVVLREADAPPDFLANNPGGRFKRRNPTVPVADLEAKWVDGCHVIYVGKGDNLRRRVKLYMDFGSGKPVGHWGGRYIWQLVDAAALLLAWRTAAPDETAGSAEAALVAKFKEQHGDRLPFANIADVTSSRVDSPPAIASTSATGRRVMPASFANSQRVTLPDIRAGRIRLPRPAKHYLPEERSEVKVALRGVQFEARYDPRTGPDRERSAVLLVGKANLERLVQPDEVLSVSLANGIVHLD